MKFFITLFSFCVLFALIQGYPSILGEPDSEGGKIHSRVRRFTCDVLSVEAKGIKLNHAACALHCLGLLKRGGYCNSKAVCVCRK
ncbi:hypothetical protein HHI36_017838 [Cryptolaemus montrouzieri]|uniref:Invertebrate defensins family profile domain-containing protein n=1 Tax=Cryptolaemus montrouzieri TaxID=559131 RepID=A0ABD2NP24_9CUCU